MDQNIHLCLDINKSVRCTIQIGIIVCILPDDTKLIRFNLGLYLVEGATLVLLNHMIWIKKILDILGQRIPQTWSLS